jgi:hypothetical protein
LSIVAGLRKGARLTKRRRREFFAIARETRDLGLALNSLSSAVLEDMLGPDGGKSVLDAFFSGGAAVYPLVKGLSQLRWPLFGDFVLAMTLEVSNQGRGREELALLGALADHGLLKRGDPKLHWVSASLDTCSRKWSEDTENEDQVSKAILHMPLPR